MIDFDRKNLARVVTIKEVINHPNADRLDIITIDEWQCVAQKGVYKAGDLCVYFEIDSILPEKIESAIFGPDAKVKLKNSRVKTIKLRGAISQGLTCPTEILFPGKTIFEKNKDVTKELGIGKYVPTPKQGSVLYTQKFKKSCDNENFTKMRKPAHLKTVGGFDDEEVMITEKIHGTSFVAGWIERENRTLSQKINKFLFGDYQFCWRSMNVQLQGDDSLFTNIKKKLKLKKEVDMSETLYGRICIKYDLKNKLFHGQVIAGEIYGSGIQDGYTYGCKEGEQKLAAFGFREHGKECIPFTVMDYLDAKKIPSVPVLYVGRYDKKTVEDCTVGRSVLDPKTKVREGCVVATLSGRTGWHGNCIVKNINPEYLLGEQSEFN